MGAAPRRITSLAESLALNGYHVRVIVPLPNYPDGVIFKGYKGKLHVREDHGNLTIDRLFIYPSNSRNPFLRILSMLSYAFSLMLFIPFLRRGKIDKVIIQSPPLFVSFTAVFLTKYFLRKPILLNVSDLWPMSAVELGVLKSEGLMFRLLTFMEHFIYKNVNLISGQSEEIIAHISAVNQETPKLVYRNLPKHISTTTSNLAASHLKSDARKTVVYAGLLGFAQGVADICRAIDFESLNLTFHIYGKGMEEAQVKEIISKLNNDSIQFHGAFAAEDAAEVLKKYDASIVPLTNRIYGAVPSKIYELIHVQLPMIFSGGGEGADLISTNQIGWVASPGNMVELEQQLKQFALTPQSELIEMKARMKALSDGKFNYEKQFHDFIGFLNSY